MEQALLVGGIVGAVGFVVVFTVEGARRPDYTARYHPVSALSLGDRGWIQVANFVVCGLLLTGFAVGVQLRLGAPFGAAALGLFGLALVASGVFSMDPMRGYPPGTPVGDPEAFSTRHGLHDAAGAVVFGAVPVAALALTPHLTGGWRIYAVATAVAGLVGLTWFSRAWEADAADTGRAQRLTIVVDLAFVALLGVHLL